MTATLTRVDPPPPPAGRPKTLMVAGRYDGPTDIQEQLLVARALAEAYGTVPSLYYKQPGNVLATMYAARTLDIGLMTAMHQLVFDNGKAGMTGALMQGLIVRAGHRIEVVRSSDKLAEMRLQRRDDQPGGHVSWTLHEATVAGLTVKHLWRIYPSDCLFWRCLSRLARRFASDVVLGFGYVPEELASISADDLTDELDRRPVEEEVQQFLADVDTADHDQLRKLWETARGNGMADRYAGVVDGLALTVEQLLVVQMERRLMAPDVVAAAAAADATPPGEGGSLPAGEGLLDCGCIARSVLKTGLHRLGCAENDDVFAEDLAAELAK